MSQLHRNVQHCQAVTTQQSSQWHKKQKGSELHPELLGRSILAERLPGCGHFQIHLIPGVKWEVFPQPGCAGLCGATHVPQV